MRGPTKRNYKGSSRKIAAARAAVGRANAVLASRSSMSSGSYGPPASRGFYGQYSLRGRAELKFVDATSTNAAVTTTWQGALINGIAQGADFNQRIGRKAQMKSVLFNGNFFPGTTAAENASQGVYLRVVIVYDSQPNSGTFPGGTDFLGANDPNTPLNLNNRDRFSILIDVRKQIGSYLFNGTPALTAGSPQNAYWNKYKKCNKETIFSGTAATLGSISTGAMYIFFVGDFNGVGMIDFYTRVRYTDM
ncbi:capsid protein [Sewage-associated circular DNA virus-18]|uniref:capsid protein n=1 Tax=Sewage-associated circular DNA virus-18 TaxID=1592085 RepID=UPI000585CB6E|nr:capsid protein [Sewage-associated circular DNA virus-18]AJD07528.1 capsid protein [Sewage-associated circular DNA virus-18]